VIQRNIMKKRKSKAQNLGLTAQARPTESQARSTEKKDICQAQIFCGKNQSSINREDTSIN
jgi:hypothetical protein